MPKRLADAAIGEIVEALGVPEGSGVHEVFCDGRGRPDALRTRTARATWLRERGWRVHCWRGTNYAYHLLGIAPGGVRTLQREIGSDRWSGGEVEVLVQEVIGGPVTASAGSGGIGEDALTALLGLGEVAE